MTPVIAHLQSNIPDLPLPVKHGSLHWTFGEGLKQFGPDFYKHIVPLHPALNLEYSILCHQLRHNFSFPGKVTKEQTVERLKAALMLAELLEQVHLDYLVVPREVTRLRNHQQLYKEMLRDMGGYTFSTDLKVIPVPTGISLTQYLRENIAQINWYRLLIARSKRLLNLLDVVGTGSILFKEFVGLMDQYSNPFFAYLAWCFFIPRLTINLFLLAKHTIPGSWMDEQEEALGWSVRFQAQLQRRWFELGNDLVWLTVGLVNCFVLIGALAPVSIYLTVGAFAFDIANAGLRAYIELNRLYTLNEEYSVLYRNAGSDEDRKAIKEYQHHINHRIGFEQLRLGLHTAGTVAIFLGMCLGLPLLTMNPVLPFIGAVLIILTWIVTYTLTQAIEKYRPNDNVEKPSGVVQFGLFARKNDEKPKIIPVPDEQEIYYDTEPTLLNSL